MYVRSFVLLVLLSFSANAQKLPKDLIQSYDKFNDVSVIETKPFDIAAVLLWQFPDGISNEYDRFKDQSTVRASFQLGEAKSIGIAFSGALSFVTPGLTVKTKPDKFNFSVIVRTKNSRYPFSGDVTFLLDGKDRILLGVLEHKWTTREAPTDRFNPAIYTDLLGCAVTTMEVERIAAAEKAEIQIDKAEMVLSPESQKLIRDLVKAAQPADKWPEGLFRKKG